MTAPAVGVGSIAGYQSPAALAPAPAGWTLNNNGSWTNPQTGQTYYYSPSLGLFININTPNFVGANINGVWTLDAAQDGSYTVDPVFVPPPGADVVAAGTQSAAFVAAYTPVAAQTAAVVAARAGLPVTATVYVSPSGVGSLTPASASASPASPLSGGQPVLPVTPVNLPATAMTSPQPAGHTVLFLVMALLIGVLLVA